MIEKRINDIFYNSIGVFKRKRKAAQPLNYIIFDTDDFSRDTNEIDVNKESFCFLKIPIHEHLYKYQEHINEVSIYQLLNEENAYIIIGNKNETKLKFILSERSMRKPFSLSELSFQDRLI